MENVMSRRRTWGPEDPSDSREIQLHVRCRRNRFVGAGLQDGSVYVTRIFTAPIKDIHLATDFTMVEGVPYHCPNHKDGHRLDEQRLRDAIYRLAPPGKPRKRGKVPSIDIESVEIVTSV
jgi:hypothetical protein